MINLKNIIDKAGYMKEEFQKMRGNDQYQKKSFHNIIRFFAIILIMTLIARGTAGAIMPKVQMVKASQETMYKNLEVSGQLERSNHVMIEVEPNIKVNTILVEVGEKIKEGDPLLEYDKDQVDNLVRIEKAEIEKLQLQYNQLLKGDIIDTVPIIDANDNLTDAVEDQNTSKVKGDTTIARATDDINDAKEDLSQVEDQYDKDKSSKDNANKELEKAKKALEALEAITKPDQATIDTAKQKVEEAETVLSDFESALEEIKTNMNSAEEVLITKKEGLQTLIDDEKLEDDEEVIKAMAAVEIAQVAVEGLMVKLVSKEAEIKQGTEDLKIVKDILATLEAQIAGNDLAKAQQRVLQAQAKLSEYEGKVQTGEAAIDQAKDNIEGSNEGLSDAQSVVQQQATADERGITNAQKSVNSANSNFLKSQEEEKDSQALNHADANLLIVTLEEKNKKLKELQEIQTQNYLKLSTQDGILRQWNIEEREPSMEVAGIITDESLGYQFIFEVREQDLSKLKHGMEFTITQNYAEVKAIVTAIGEQNVDETFTITAKIEEGDICEGSGSGKISISEKEYNTCIPSSAVRQDNEGTFVYGVEERNTILGLQNIVYRIPITVEESSQGYTAVAGALYAGDGMVFSSSKGIRAGDRVRLE